MAERTTVRLPPSLLAAAKKKAAAEGRTLTSLIEDGLRRVIEAPPPKAEPARLPVSEAKGGLRPGMNLTFSELEELEDAEYVERLMRGFR